MIFSTFYLKELRSRFLVTKNLDFEYIIFVSKQELFEEHLNKTVTCTNNPLYLITTKQNMFHVNSKNTDTDKN